MKIRKTGVIPSRQIIITVEHNTYINEYQYNLIIGNYLPQLQPVSLIEEESTASFFINTSHNQSYLETTRSQEDQTDHEILLYRGKTLLKDILEIILKAEDLLLPEQQFILDLDYIMAEKSDDIDGDYRLNLICLPASYTDDTTDFSLPHLIRQIAELHEWREEILRAAIKIYLEHGLKILHSCLVNDDLSISSGQTDGLTTKRPSANSAAGNFTCIAEKSDHNTPGSVKKQRRCILSLSTKFLERLFPRLKPRLSLIIHLVWLLSIAGFMTAASQRLINYHLKNSGLIIMLAAGLLLAVYDLRRAASKISFRKYRGKAGLSSDEGQTELIGDRNSDYAMAVISEGLPGSPEENEGLRAFILIDEFIIGRDAADSDLHINDSTIGRRHARIKRYNGSYFLTDLGSKNGTRLDGRKLNRNEEYILPDRCRLHFADRSFYFETQ